MDVCEFSKLLFGEVKDGVSENQLREEIRVEEKHLLRIRDYLATRDVKEKEKYFHEIINNPNRENGKIYELLVYSWLAESSKQFKTQIRIDSEKCLKENSYEADGELENIVVFEIKKFGIGLGLYSRFQEKLQEICHGYLITVGGEKNLSSKVIEKDLIGKVTEWKDKLFEPENCIHTDYIYWEPHYCLEIRAHEITEEHFQIATSISEIDNTKWAQENELYFFRHGSQFCSDRPYIIICPFFPTDALVFSGEDMSLYFMFRLLCRRMFMRVCKETQRKLKEIDGKAKADVSLATASRKLSAVVFLDISEKWDYHNCRCWVYTNPNADFPAPRYIMSTFFCYAGARIDEFYYDNY